MNQTDRELYDYSQVQPEELQYSSLNDYEFYDPIWNVKINRPKNEIANDALIIFGGEKC